MVLLSEVYDVTLKKGNRGKGKTSRRPTLAEFFITNHDYQQNTIPSNYTLGFTDDLCEGGTSFGDESLGTGHAKAFDNANTDLATDAWLATSFPMSIGYDFGAGNEKKIQKINLYATNRVNRVPEHFIFQGGPSTSGPWTDLLTVTDDNLWSENFSMKSYIFDNDTNFRCYRLYITEGDHSSECELGEIEMMELTTPPHITGWHPDQTVGGAPSSSIGGTNNYRPFDDDFQAGSDRWTANTSSMPQWLGYEFIAPKQIELVKILAYYHNGAEPIKDLKIVASETGAFAGEEVILHTDVYPDAYLNTDWMYYYFKNTNSYKYYRIVIDSYWYGNSGNDPHIDLVEMREAITVSNPENSFKFQLSNTSATVDILADYTVKAGGWTAARIPITKNSGKWFIELANVPTNSITVGVCDPTFDCSNTATRTGLKTLCYDAGTAGADKLYSDGGTEQTFSTTRSSTDYIGIAYDADNHEFSVYRNGTYVGGYTQTNVTNQLDDFVFFVGGYGAKILYLCPNPKNTITGYKYINE